MFDTYKTENIVDRKEVAVTQNLAPVADHLRLLEEMRKELRKEMDTGFVLQFPLVTNVFAEVVSTMPGAAHRISFRYELNSRRYEGHVDADVHGMQYTMLSDIEGALRQLHQDVIDKIAQHIATNLATEMVKGHTNISVKMLKWVTRT